MEYYEGILILTTNRIKTFDVAVQSRVNLAIRYQDLSVEDRKKIFRNF
jgi:AAA+ superfamily predicted ATPase